MYPREDGADALDVIVLNGSVFSASTFLVKIKCSHTLMIFAWLGSLLVVTGAFTGNMDITTSKGRSG